MVAAAAAFLGAAIQVVKWVAEPIKRQFNYLCCFTSNINNLRNEAKRLGDATQGLQLQVDRATDNLQVIVPQVNTWLIDSSGINGEVNGILNEARLFEDCLKIGARFSLSKRAKKTTDRSKEHRGQNNFVSIAQPGPPPATLTVPGGKTYEFESRKKIEEGIMTTLRDGDVNLIGIYGMGGLGKTTMAERIRNSVLNEHVFEEVAMAVVSQQADKSKIQVEIGGSLGLDLKDETSQGKVQKLHARLSGTKRILVILDDVWEGLELENLGIPCDSKGCTILITSRNKDALDQMSVQKIFEMKVLSEDDAWFLFGEKANISGSDTNLNSIAKQVMKECGGLPIALTVIGAALKGKKDLAIWKDALGRLRKVHQKIPDFIQKVYGPLKFSYDFLQSEEAESLFLLCCLFKEDDDISLKYLTYFCTGLGILEGIDTLEEARNRMCTLVEMLKSRSLLLESDKEDCVRMHDVVRDVCIYIAKQKGCIGGNNCTWVSSSQFVGERNEILTESRCPNLRLLSLSLSSSEEEEFEFGSAFLEGINDLYVFSVNSYQKLTSLPHTTQSLMNLKTLLLDWSPELKSISVVGELRNLEILIFRHCYSIEELPAEMKGLNRLKLLELTGCWKLRSIGRGIISSLIALEELKMVGSFDKWEAEDREERENASIKELEALPNLACLEIDIHSSVLTENMPLLSKKIVRFRLKTNGPNLLPSKFSKAMNLRLERESCLGDWIEKQLLKDTEYLWLRGDGANNLDFAKIQNIRECESMKNVVTTSGGDDATVFPSIEHLKLESLPELQEICDGLISSTSFQNLKELKLWNLNALTQFWKSSSVCENNNNVPHFSNLSSIEISDCPCLRNLGQLSLAGKDCLPQLQQLHIMNCSMMEQVFLWNKCFCGTSKCDEMRKVIEDKEQQGRILVFPKLKELKLKRLPKLVSFSDSKCEVEFPILREVEIYDCPNMESLSMGLVATPNLETFATDLTTYVGVGVDVAFDSLMKELEIRENENPFVDRKISVSLFNRLEKLNFWMCEGSMSLFSSSAVGNLDNLRVLEIQYSDEMLVKVIEDEDGKVVSGGVLFPKLEELYLEDLPKLVSFCEWKCDVQLPSLRQVQIYDCPNMKSFSLGSVAAPNLKSIFMNGEYIEDAKEMNGALQQCLAQKEEEEEGGEEEQEGKDEIQEEEEDDHN